MLSSFSNKTENNIRIVKKQCSYFNSITEITMIYRLFSPWNDSYCSKYSRLVEVKHQYMK